MVSCPRRVKFAVFVIAGVVSNFCFKYIVDIAGKSCKLHFGPLLAVLGMEWRRINDAKTPSSFISGVAM